MTFKNYESSGQYELCRITSGEYSVIDGANKVYTEFMNKYKPETVIAYCDRSKFTGNVYKQLGFKLEEHIPPEYIWIKHNSKGDEVIQCSEEHKITQKQNYFKVYNCGLDKFQWNNQTQ